MLNLLDLVLGMDKSLVSWSKLEISNSQSQIFPKFSEKEDFLKNLKSRRRWQNIYYIADELEYRGLLYVN